MIFDVRTANSTYRLDLVARTVAGVSPVFAPRVVDAEMPLVVPVVGRRFVIVFAKPDARGDDFLRTTPIEEVTPVDDEARAYTLSARQEREIGGTTANCTASPTSRPAARASSGTMRCCRPNASATRVSARAWSSVTAWDSDPPEACTGVSARWCPIHGRCVCPEGELNHPACDLHGFESSHGGR